MEPLTYFDVVRSDTEEDGLGIKIEGLKQDVNAEGFELVKNLNVLVYDGDEYIIHDYNKWTDGDSVKCDAEADHRVYVDLDDVFIYEKKTGTFTMAQLLTQALSGTGYTFAIDSTGLPANVTVENFGWAHSKDLVKDIASKFGAEWRPSGKQLIFAKQIGTNRDEILRYTYNMNDPRININSSEFKTYIKGYGKQNEDGSYVVTADYTSPLAAIYGKKEATPLEDERFTVQANLVDELKRTLNDSLPISLTFTAVELEEMGLKNIKRGDTVWCVIQPLGIDVRIRAVSKEDYSDPTKTPTFTFGRIERSATSIVAGYNETSAIISSVVDTTTGKVKSTAVDTSGITIPITQTTGQIDESRLSFSVPSYTLASALSDGLMSKEDFQKLSRLVVDANGNASVDLTAINNTISAMQQQITDLTNRVQALENTP